MQEEVITESERNITSEARAIRHQKASKIREIESALEGIDYEKFHIDIHNREHEDLIVDILYNDKRSVHENNILLTFLVRLEFFNSRGEDLTKLKKLGPKFFRELSIESYKKGEIIFNYGEIGKKFYVLLRGRCLLLLPRSGADFVRTKSNAKDEEESETEQGENFNATNSGSPMGAEAARTLTKRSSLMNEEQVPEHIRLEHEEQRLENAIHQIEREQPNLEKLKVFEPGDSFGEISLITGARRTGTIISCLESDYLVITKQIFDELMNIFKRQELESKLDFLKEYPFFQELEDNKLMSLMLDIKSEKCIKGEVIYRKGDKVDFLYLLKQGNIRISEKLEFKANEKTKHARVKSLNNLSKMTLNFYSNIGEGGNEEEKVEITFEKSLPLVILGENSYFGEMEILEDLPERITTAECESADAEIFAIEKNLLVYYMRQLNCLDLIKRQSRPRQNFEQYRERVVQESEALHQAILNNKKRRRKESTKQIENGLGAQSSARKSTSNLRGAEEMQTTATAVALTSRRSTLDHLEQKLLPPVLQIQIPSPTNNKGVEQVEGETALPDISFRRVESQDILQRPNSMRTGILDDLYSPGEGASQQQLQPPQSFLTNPVIKKNSTSTTRNISEEALRDSNSMVIGNVATLSPKQNVEESQFSNAFLQPELVEHEQSNHLDSAQEIQRKIYERSFKESRNSAFANKMKNLMRAREKYLKNITPKEKKNQLPQFFFSSNDRILRMVKPKGLKNSENMISEGGNSRAENFQENFLNEIVSFDSESGLRRFGRGGRRTEDFDHLLLDMIERSEHREMNTNQNSYQLNSPSYGTTRIAKELNIHVPENVIVASQQQEGTTLRHLTPGDSNSNSLHQADSRYTLSVKHSLGSEYNNHSSAQSLYVSSTQVEPKVTNSIHNFKRWEARKIKKNQSSANSPESIRAPNSPRLHHINQWTVNNDAVTTIRETEGQNSENNARFEDIELQNTYREKLVPGTPINNAEKTSGSQLKADSKENDQLEQEEDIKQDLKEKKNTPLKTKEDFEEQVFSNM